MEKEKGTNGQAECHDTLGKREQENVLEKILAIRVNGPCPPKLI